MKKFGIKNKIIFALMLGVCVLMTACQNEQTGTKLQISFETSEKADSYDEKKIYINEAQEEMELNASLKLDEGEVLLQVVSVGNETVVWENSYKQSSDFLIELKDLKADSEYTIKVQAKDAKKVDLTITSEEMLVKDIEKPDK